MQDRVTNSPYALSQSAESHPIRANHKSKASSPSKSNMMIGGLIGIVFWSVVGAALCCGFSLSTSAAHTNDDNILLDFSAKWCGPCQKMSPIVSELERQGLPIRKVDVDVEKALASRFNVQGIPCFVLVSNGREIDRVTGMTDERSLRRMMAKLPKPASENGPIAKAARNVPVIAASNSTISKDRKILPKIQSLFTKSSSNEIKLTPINEPDTIRSQTPPRTQEPDQFSRDVLTASIRIRIDDGASIHYGSGTIIDSQPGRSIVLTCGHIFRGLSKDAVVEVDYYPGGKSTAQTVVGKILSYDLKPDLGLLSIPTDEEMPVVKLGTFDDTPEVKTRVVSIGCGGGEHPSPENHVVTAVNRYVGPDNIECDGVPEKGRSGGGLFRDSKLVGVCIAADPKDRRGIYTGLKPIAQLLAKTKLGNLLPMSPPADTAVAAASTPETKSTANDFDRMEEEAVTAAADGNLARTIDNAMKDSTESDLNIADYEGAEIVCIVRPKTPGALSRIVVVNQASSRFVDDLLRDSKGNGRSGLDTAARKSSRKMPVSGEPIETVVASNNLPEARKPAIRKQDTEKPARGVETSFDPQRYRRSRN